MADDDIDTEVMDILLGVAAKTAKERRGDGAGYSDYLRWRQNSLRPDRSLVAGALERAIAVVAFGPSNASFGAVRRVRRALVEEGTWLCPLEESGVGHPGGWAAREVGGGTGINAVDPERLRAWILKLYRAMLTEPRVGMVVTVSRGLITAPRPGGAPRMVHGEAVAEGAQLAHQIVEGQILLTAAASRLLGAQGPSIIISSQGPALIPVAPEPPPINRLPLPSSASAAGWPTASARLAIGNQVYRQMRRGAGDGPLCQGDVLKLTVSARLPIYTYGILMRDEHLEVLEAGGALLTPTGTSTREIRVELDNRPGTDTPIFINATRPLEGLNLMVAEVNDADLGPPAQRVKQLHTLLSQVDDVVEILPGKPWNHMPDGDLAELLERLETGPLQPQQVTELANDLLLRAPCKRVSAQAHLARARAQRRQEDIAGAHTSALLAVVDAQKAGATALEALAIAESALTRRSLAAQLPSEQDIHAAREEAGKALSLAQDLDDARVIAQVRHVRGEMALIDGNWKAAEKEASLGIRALKNQHPDLRCQLWLLGSRSARSAGRNGEAAEHGRRALALAYGSGDEINQEAAGRLLKELAAEERGGAN